MWQRVQTVFLALVVVSLVLALFYPLAEGISEDIMYKLFPLHFSSFENKIQKEVYFPFCITAVLMVAASTIALMQLRRYDDRITQIKMGTLNSLILMGVMGSAVYFIYNIPSQYPGQWQKGFGLWFLFAGVTFNWLAVRFIRRDEKLVKDSNRLR